MQGMVWQSKGDTADSTGQATGKQHRGRPRRQAGGQTTIKTNGYDLADRQEVQG